MAQSVTDWRCRVKLDLQCTCWESGSCVGSAFYILLTWIGSCVAVIQSVALCAF